MNFHYRVRDPQGKVLQGYLEADSEEAATQQLRRDGSTVMELEEVGDDEDFALFGRRVPKGELIYVTNQLAIMVETGIPLSVALQAILDQTQQPGLRYVLKDVKRGVEAGEDFSIALARHPKVFNKTYVSLVKASESTGTMAAMLDRIADYLRKEAEARSKVRAAMAYPTVMMLIAVGVSIFLLVYVLPKFTPLFSSKGMKLPKPTAVMLAMSSALTDYWYAWLVAGVALVVGLAFARRTQQGRQVIDAIKINLPILGPMFRKVVISRSLRTLGAMINGGVPVLDALRLCSEIAGNYQYEQLWLHVADEVTMGKRIRDALVDSSLFPPTLVQMIASGEETGKLGRVLERVGDYYDREVEVSLKAVTALIEPVMIGVMSIVVGGIGLALLLPIFQLTHSQG